MYPVWSVDWQPVLPQNPISKKPRRFHMVSALRSKKRFGFPSKSSKDPKWMYVGSLGCDITPQVFGPAVARGRLQTWSSAFPVGFLICASFRGLKPCKQWLQGSNQALPWRKQSFWMQSVSFCRPKCQCPVIGRGNKVCFEHTQKEPASGRCTRTIKTISLQWRVLGTSNYTLWSQKLGQKHKLQKLAQSAKEAAEIPWRPPKVE